MEPQCARGRLPAAALLSALASAVLSVPAEAADVYAQRVRPFMQQYCIQCHGAKKARGELNFDRFSQDADLVRDFRRWNNVLEFVRKGQMPPGDSRQPPPAERTAMVAAVEEILLAEALRHAGDPGAVPPRRLSNTEFDIAVRDLTGVDVRPTRDFPADPAGGEGFDNTGEALTMSPNLLGKYLGAARQVASHLVLGTDGIRFAPFPVTSYNERRKLTEGAILDFYRDHEVRIADYLEAAWRFRHRGAADKALDANAWARRSRLSGKYLAMVLETLEHASSNPVGFLKPLGGMWKALPPPADGQARPAELNRLIAYVEFCRAALCPRDEGLVRANAGNWPIQHLDFRARTAEARDKFDPARLVGAAVVKFDRIRVPKKPQEPAAQSFHVRIDPVFEGGGGFVVIRRPTIGKADSPRGDDETLKAFLEREAPQAAAKLGFGTHPLGHAIDADSLAVRAPGLIEIPVPAAAVARLDGKAVLFTCELDAEHSKEAAVFVRRSTGRPPDASGGEPLLLVSPRSRTAADIAASAGRLCDTFPNRFYYADPNRGVAAGFHLIEGFFRDDRPLVRKVLTGAQAAELDRLWRELEFVTEAAETLLRGVVWFERTERKVIQDKSFEFLRSEDPLLVEEELLGRFERAYLPRMGVKLVGDSLTPERPGAQFDMIHGFFEQVRAGLKRQRELAALAEQKGLRDLEALARRAFRRELRQKEAESLRTLYRTVRGQGQSAEESLRSVFTAVLLSPAFCCRFVEAPPGTGAAPLSDDALAGRLSGFLWSSPPDAELLAAAAAGRLQDESVLAAQTRRMLQDPRMADFAREFFGQWLRFRDFLAVEPVHAAAFPGYTEDVRRAMFEEPVRLAAWLIKEDKPVTDLLGSDVTFVNGALAAHYGGGIAEQYRRRSAEWLDDLRGRGLPAPPRPEEQWFRVEGLLAEGRGGLLGMGVLLTRNSSGERTSPVKRGFWTVHRLLGRHFPPPPADVPELPKAEKSADRTIRELLAAHTADARCAMCHVHFDGLGVALEGFDPVGRRRTRDLAGRPIDDVATLPEGRTARGVPGLIRYLETDRKAEFVETLCRKLLGYALGRSVALSDRPLLDRMRSVLENNGYRFQPLFETVVGSPQFRRQRGRDFPADAP